MLHSSEQRVHFSFTAYKKGITTPMFLQLSSSHIPHRSESVGLGNVSILVDDLLLRLELVIMLHGRHRRALARHFIVTFVCTALILKPRKGRVKLPKALCLIRTVFTLSAICFDVECKNA